MMSNEQPVKTDLRSDKSDVSQNSFQGEPIQRIIFVDVDKSQSTDNSAKDTNEDLTTNEKEE